MKWLHIVLQTLAVLPAVTGAALQLVQQFERPGHGAAKKQAVVDAVGLAYDAATHVASQAEATLPPTVSRDTVTALAGGAAEIGVALFNLTGWPH